MPQSKNIARLSEDMKRELIAIIGQMKDPRLKTGLLTVMRIELAPDLSFAKVFVSVLGTQPDAPQQAVAALNRAAGHVRSEVERARCPAKAFRHKTGSRKSRCGRCLHRGRRATRSSSAMSAVPVSRFSMSICLMGW